MKKKSLKKKPKSDALYANPELVLREEGKDALLFDPDTGAIKVLNYVGKMIYKLLDGSNSKVNIKNKIIKKFKDADPKQIESDLDRFLKTLEDYGYIGKKVQ